MLKRWRSRTPTSSDPGFVIPGQYLPSTAQVDFVSVQKNLNLLARLFGRVKSSGRLLCLVVIGFVLIVAATSYYFYESHNHKSSIITKSTREESANNSPVGNNDFVGDQTNPAVSGSDNKVVPNSSKASSGARNSTGSTSTVVGTSSGTGGTSSGGSTGGGLGSGGSSSGVTGAYGTLLATDGLANLEIGKANGRTISYRFRATHTGNISTIGNFFVYRAGYFAGTGGQVRLSLQTDDGSVSHLPSGTVLASHTISDPMATNFRTFSLDTSAYLISGQIYHFVYTNPDSNPVANYVSIDDMYQASPGSQMQPTISDTDQALVWKYDTASSWTVNRNHTPIYIIHFNDGSTQGQGYIDALSGSGLQSIGASNQVEEIFTVSGSARSVSKVIMRLAKTGSSALTVTLKQGSTTVTSVSVPASSISSSYSWITANLPSSVTLDSGTSYAVVLSASSNSYNVFPAQEGTSYGLSGGNNFTDGRYSFSSNSGSSFQNLSGRTDYDLQLYLQ